MRKILLSFLLLFLLLFSQANATNYCTDANTQGAWKFDEVSGTLADCTSNANNSTNVTNVTEGATGKYSNALQFTNGYHQVVQLPLASDINPITICAWINPTVLTGTGGGYNGDYSDVWILDKNYRAKLFGLMNTGDITYGFHTSFNTYVWRTTGHPVTTASWQHVCVTMDNSSTSNHPIFYYNGSAVAGDSGGFGGTIDSDAGSTLDLGQESLGSGTVSGAGFFTGSLDELMVYHGVLDATAIANEYACGIDGSQCISSTFDTKFYNVTIKNLTLK